jgi:hypothetical protein
LEQDEGRADEACSEDLNNEGLELLLALLTVAELQPFMIEKGATREFLEELQEYVNDCELGNNTAMVNG